MKPTNLIKYVSIPEILIFLIVLAKLILDDGKFECWGAIFQTFTISVSETLSRVLEAIIYLFVKTRMTTSIREKLNKSDSQTICPRNHYKVMIVFV